MIAAMLAACGGGDEDEWPFEGQTAPSGHSDEDWPEWEPPVVPDQGEILLDLAGAGGVDHPSPDEDDLDVDDPESEEAFADSLDAPGDCVWELDEATDTFYRRVRESEVEMNGWSAGDVVIVAPRLVFDLTHGARGVEVGFVLEGESESDEGAGLRVAHERLELRRSHRGARVAVQRPGRRGGVEVEAFAPVFHGYAQPGLRAGLHLLDEGDLYASAVGDDRGGVHVEAILVDRVATLRGPVVGAYLECREPAAGDLLLQHTEGERRGGFSQRYEVLAPGEPAPAAEPPQQCQDGFDNDASGYADECDLECLPHPDYGGEDFDGARPYENTKSFGLFGDAVYCTENAGSWWTEMQVAADDAALLLNQIDPPDTEADAPPLRYVMGGCVVFPSLEQASQCHQQGDCPAGYEDYPYADFGIGPNAGSSNGNEPGGYLGGVWDMVDWTAKRMALAGAEPVPIHLAVVWGEQIEGYLRGRSYTGWGTDYMRYKGGAVTRPSAGFMPIAHEMGHLLGLPHDDGEYQGVSGVMTVNGGTAPILGEAVDGNGVEPGLTPYEIWEKYPAGKFFPRASGLRYTEIDCSECAYHQDLHCVQPVEGSIFCKDSESP